MGMGICLNAPSSVEVAMRLKHQLWLYGSLFLISGCGLTQTVTRNIISEPLGYDKFTDAFSRHGRDTGLANEAWAEVCHRDGDIYSKHYYRGFVAGFTDFLDMGGDGQPPVLPPRNYWRIYYQNPEGQMATQDWFTGFRHGADVARNSGVRELVTVPVSYVPPKENDLNQSNQAVTDQPKSASTSPEKKVEMLGEPKNMPKPATNPTTNPAPVKTDLPSVKPPEPGLPKLGTPAPMNPPGTPPPK